MSLDTILEKMNYYNPKLLNTILDYIFVEINLTNIDNTNQFTYIKYNSNCTKI